MSYSQSVQCVCAVHWGISSGYWEDIMSALGGHHHQCTEDIIFVEHPSHNHDIPQCTSQPPMRTAHTLYRVIRFQWCILQADALKRHACPYSEFRCIVSLSFTLGISGTFGRISLAALCNINLSNSDFTWKQCCSSPVPLCHIQFRFLTDASLQQVLVYFAPDFFLE